MSYTQLDPAAPPAHHVHKSSDRLPTHSNPSPGSGPTSYIAESPGQALDGGDNISTTATAGGDHSAFSEQRPLNTQPDSEGGVAREGDTGLPEGKAGITDKIVGKTEKVIGKAKKNPELHEKGELREAGGKAAATGQARAPHD